MMLNAYFCFNYRSLFHYRGTIEIEVPLPTELALRQASEQQRSRFPVGVQIDGGPSKYSIQCFFVLRRCGHKCKLSQQV